MYSARLLSGVIAGFAATVGFSIVLLVLIFLDPILAAGGIVLPVVDPVAVLAVKLGTTYLMGWGIHFLIGTVLWGGLYALLEPNIAGSSHIVKGIVLGVGAWSLMMIIAMPMAGAGLFPPSFGIYELLNLLVVAPMLILMMHIVFGGVLGGVYKALRSRGENIAGSDGASAVLRT